MSYQAHRTPGPWTYDRVTGSIHRGAYTVIRHAGLLPADGCLIAAAPELLRALKRVLDVSFCEQEVQAQALASIAKAENRGS